MSWLYTIVFAGLMFSADSAPPIAQSNNFIDSNITNVVKADETERFEQTYPLTATGRVSVSNVNGSITVQTWDRNEVKLEYVKTADSKEGLADVTVRIEARADSFSVETDYGDSRRYRELNRAELNDRRNYNRSMVEYRLMVPRTAVLDDIETVNGSVNITNASGTTKASAVNGEVRATNLRGTADLTTVNGMVVANFDQLQSGSKISLNTVNGTVDLVIPSDANATVKADTVNGSINNDFGLPVRKGEYVGRDLYGKIGSGDVQIRLNSVNGGLAIKRKNDGKSVNPAVNLLNMKNSGNGNDWDDDEAKISNKPPKLPKPPKAPKMPIIVDIDNEAIRRSIEDSLKQTNVELGKLTPEIAKKYEESIRLAEVMNSKEMQAKIEAAQKKYSESFAKLSEGYWTVGSPIIEKKSDTFTVKGTPKVKVEAKNCAVYVRGWDKSEVQYTITRISKSRTQTPLDIQATQNNSDINIKVANADKDIQNSEIFYDLNRIRIEVFVPKKSDLKITTSGEIRLEGVSGEIDLQGTDEAINVRDSDGKLNVATTEGRIRVIGFRGAFDGKTLDGTMNLEGDFQSFNALATEGTIVLTLPENVNANLESNAEIESEGINLIRDNEKSNLWRAGKGGKLYRMNVSDGSVIVRGANNLAVY